MNAPLAVMDRTLHAAHAECSAYLAELLRDEFDATVRFERLKRCSYGHDRSPDVFVVGDDLLGAEVRRLRERYPAARILGLLGSVAGDPEVDPLQQGVDDFVTAPLRPLDVLPRLRRLVTSISALETTSTHQSEPIVGSSVALRSLLAGLPDIAMSDANVLISGETGTGKELVARAIHYRSLRHGKPFVPVNCGAIPEHLMENELFGHSVGAYTDARSDERGLLGEAQGGTLFLDEVDALPPAGQVKLLRFLQNREYRPLGSARTLTADVRVLSASNSVGPGNVRVDGFREDLYFRLNILSMHLPPLRDRTDDIPLLVAHFLTRYRERCRRQVSGVEQSVIDVLMEYDWPGNVRELEAVIHRAVLLSREPLVTLRDIDIAPARIEARSGEPSFNDAKEHAINSFERTYLIRLLMSHGGNVSHAARAALKDRRSLQRLLRKHGVDRQSFRSP